VPRAAIFVVLAHLYTMLTTPAWGRFVLRLFYWKAL